MWPLVCSTGFIKVNTIYKGQSLENIFLHASKCRFSLIHWRGWGVVGSGAYNSLDRKRKHVEEQMTAKKYDTDQ